MSLAFAPFFASSGPLAAPPLLTPEQAGPAMHVHMNRRAKRHSIGGDLPAQPRTAFVDRPRDFGGAVMGGAASRTRPYRQARTQGC